jgi:glycosyltransferase involved in cell wall biosynthesis
MKHCLYICYYHLSEPLVQTQVVSYLRELASHYRVHLLTFERGVNPSEAALNARNELAADGIQWHILRYHQRPSLAATLYDIAVGAIKALRVCRENDIQIVHARSYVPAAMALILKRLIGSRFLFDVRGLLADEYVDAGHWASGDIKYKLTKRMERAFFRHADHFVFLTHRIKEDLANSDSGLQERQHDISVIPCCVDIETFRITTGQRERYRKERGWTNRRVLTYVGKLGTWYLADEMARFFSVARQVIPGLFFQVLTQSEPAPIAQALLANKIPEEDYDIRFAKHTELPLVLAASNAGISFIKECYSKRSSSPTKIGEYLAAGLPVVTNSGIGDCDELISSDRLGIIVRKFADDEYVRSAGELLELMDDHDVSVRCHRAAEEKLAIKTVGGPGYLAVYRRLLEGPVESPVSVGAAEILKQ